MQRLYSTFPNGRPGVGLLLLRLAAGGSLIFERIPMITPVSSSSLWEIHMALVFVGVCVCLGIWTPIAGGFEAAAEALMTLSRPAQYQGHVLLAVLTVSLTMLGPGAWSIDALIFGRKRIAI